MGDKSIRIAIWSSEQSKNEICKDHLKSIDNREESTSITISKYDFSDLDITRIGYKIRENDGRKEYDVIYEFSIVEKEIIQLALYFDNPEDKAWVIEIWKNIKDKKQLSKKS